MKPPLPYNENDQNLADTDGCSVCKELLVNLGRFIERIEAIRSSYRSDWLTVEDIAQELKLSKSIVYRLIRNGDLEAVDLVVGDEGEIRQRGHYRVRRSSLNNYLDSRRVQSRPSRTTQYRPKHYPRVKNHLGL